MDLAFLVVRYVALRAHELVEQGALLVHRSLLIDLAAPWWL
jgi:hypothetical protein